MLNIQHHIEATSDAVARWHRGEWDALASLKEASIEKSSDRMQLALLGSSARFQLGDFVGAKRMLAKAREWGADEHIVAAVIIAGVHNSLGRACLLLEHNEERIRGHFLQAVTGLEGGTRAAAAVRARREVQHLVSAGVTPLLPPTFTWEQENVGLGRRDRRPEVHILAIESLGSGWGGNSVNTAIFRQQGVVSSARWQFTAFYVDDRTLRVVQRDFETGNIFRRDLPGEYSIVDAHNTISLGLDRRGQLHMAYGSHGSRIRYRRTTAEWCIDQWSDEMSMTGIHEGKVTYPSFVQPLDECPCSPLLFIYRDGRSECGSTRMKTLDDEGRTWIDSSWPLFSGTRNKPWASNAYWNRPVRSPDGSLHLSFVWRTHSVGARDRINNINVCYARSTDNGTSWQTSKGWRYRMPITQINAETILAVPPATNLINQCGMAVDALGHAHIAFYSDTLDEDCPQFRHLWYDGIEWQCNVVSNRTKPFLLAGRETLKVPISRPEILIDVRGDVCILFRDETQRMMLTKLVAPNYRYCPESTAVVWEGDIGFSEPVVDHSRWQREGILSMFMQRNDQPDHDISHEQRAAPAFLCDFKIGVAL